MEIFKKIYDYLRFIEEEVQKCGEHSFFGKF
jgi:hypothetical protein